MRKANCLAGISCITLLSGCATVTSSQLHDMPTEAAETVAQAETNCADSSSFECPGTPLVNAGIQTPPAIAASPLMQPGLTYYLPRQLVKLTAVRTDPAVKTLLDTRDETKADAKAATAARQKIETDIAAIKAKIPDVRDSAKVLEMLFKDLKKLEDALPEAKKAEEKAKDDATAASDKVVAYKPADVVAATNSSVLTFELLPMAPDPAFAFRLDPKHSWLRDDNHKIALTANGLLTSTDIVAPDRTADILAQIAIIAGYASGLGGMGGRDNSAVSPADARIACQGAPDKVVAIVDLAVPSEIDRFNHDVQCLGVKIELATASARYPGRMVSVPVPKMPGIFYRPVVDVAVRVSYCGTTVCLGESASWFLKDTLNVPLPQFGAISPVPQRSGFMTRTAYKNTFKDGILVDYDADRPSELLEVARTPVRLVGGFFDGFSKIISLRTGANTDRVNMSASELSTFQSLAGDAEKQRLYRKCAAEKTAADEPLTPCLDLLD